MTKSNESIREYKWCLLLLCILPILDPYAINGSGSVMIVNVIALFLAMCCVLTTKISMNQTFLSLIFYFLVSSILSGFFTSSTSIDFVLEAKVLFAWMILLVSFSFLWRYTNKKNFYKIMVGVGVACAGLALIQYIALYIGFSNIYDGRLPFPIGDNNDFGGLVDINTGDIRVHSFFEEPSYLSIFELPIFAYCLKNKKILSAVIIGLTCIITSTLLGIIGLSIVLTYCILFDTSLSVLQRIFIAFVAVIIISVLIYLGNNNPYVSDLFNYYSHRFSGVEGDFDREDSSVSLRLVGNISYFEDYPLLNKIFGVGFNQHGVYFKLKKNYSNDIVSTIMDFGILGLIAFIITMVVLFFKINREGKVYFIILIMVMMVDHIWFNTYFFYLMTWCTFHFKKNDDICLKL